MRLFGIARPAVFAALALLWLVSPAAAQNPLVQSRFFTTSDGVRLHYLEAGAQNSRILLLVPGWTMPAWIWTPQITAFSRSFRVIAFDPRGQGDSDAPAWGYDQDQRAKDLAELIARLQAPPGVPGFRPAPIVVVGWSLGVLDTLAFVHRYGDALISGLVLVDNSVGEEPAPVPKTEPVHRVAPAPRAMAMRRFVEGMFAHPQTQAYLDRLTAAALRTPEAASRLLLSYPVPRSYWRDAIYATDKPVLYVVRPRFAGQAANLERKRPHTDTAVFPDAGHALFVDDAIRFNALVERFLRLRVWP
jgi:microsomal epoxide hydrolase